MPQRIDVRTLTAWIQECARVIALEQDALSELDSSTGDADHGSNMARGFAAVCEAVSEAAGDGPSALLEEVGVTLVDNIGGSSGALYGTFFLRMARAVGEADQLDGPAFGEALRAGAQGIVDRGSVRTGDKTMYDALAPAVEAYHGELASSGDLSAALEAASTAAEHGRDATASMVARKGRSSYVGDRSLGHVDAGASSMALLIRAASTTVRGAAAAE